MYRKLFNGGNVSLSLRHRCLCKQKNRLQNVSKWLTSEENFSSKKGLISDKNSLNFAQEIAPKRTTDDLESKNFQVGHAPGPP